MKSNCLFCKNTFGIQFHMLKRGKGKFCSASCRSSFYIYQLEPYKKKKGETPWNKGLKGAQKGWNKGLKCPKISKKMMGNKNALGMIHSEISRHKMSILAKGRVFSTETREKIRQKLLGKSYVTELGRKKISLAHRGEKNSSWKGGISKINKTERQLAMETVEYHLWRKSVFERDEYTCRICDQAGGRLNADHIKPWSMFPELRYAIDNGRTLCETCHRLTDTYGNRILVDEVTTTVAKKGGITK